MAFSRETFIVLVNKYIGQRVYRNASNEKKKELLTKAMKEFQMELGSSYHGGYNEYQRQWFLDHKEQIRDYKRQWKKDNAEHLKQLEASPKYVLWRRNYQREYQRKYRVLHKEKVKLCQRESYRRRKMKLGSAKKSDLSPCND